MKISIAMATYNGAKYLQEQLDSFVAQTHQPDELVVTDDGSSDDTLRILDDFAKSAPFVVTIVRNDKNLGYAQNFSKALSLCAGELVFLSDQDDVWFNDKIATIVQQAQVNPNTLLFMNDAELTLGDGTPLRLTKLGQTLSLGLGESAFTTGCCMAIRWELVQLALPVPMVGFAHDTWLNQLALLLQARKVMPCAMQYYRRHGENTSDWIASRTTEQDSVDLIKHYQEKDPRPYAKKRLDQLDEIEVRLRAKGASGDVSPVIARQVPSALENIENVRRAVKGRLRLLEQPRATRWLGASRFFWAGQYAYFSGWKSWIKDMVKE